MLCGQRPRCVSGSASLGAQLIGVLIAGNGSDNHIGLDPADNSLDPADKRNVISGNTYQNISIVGSRNTVAGNYIGVDATGTIGLGTGGAGVFIGGGANVIGTDSDGVNDDLERNIISGNLDGIESVGGNDNVIAGNYIGTDTTGTTVTNLGNGRFANGTGIFIHESGTVNQILGNVIAGSQNGVALYQPGVSNNVVAGNDIGTDWTGHVAVGDTLGVNISSSPSNRIGGTTALDRNLISGNGVGVYIQGTSMSNEILGNWAGTDGTGAGPLGNGNGVVINDSASGNEIGGTAPGQSNTIAFNGNSSFTAIICVSWRAR